MRAFKIVLTAAIVMAIAGSAWATTLPKFPTGQLRLKYTNWDNGVQYGAAGPVVGEANMNALPQLPPIGGPVRPDGRTEDAWFVARMTNIWDNWQGGTNLFNDGDNNTEIVGFGYGLVDVGLGSNGSILSKDYTIEIWAQDFGNFDYLIGSSGRTGFDTYTGIGINGAATGAVLLAKFTSTVTPNFGTPPLENFGTPDPYSHIAASTGRSDMYVTGVDGLWFDGDLTNGEVTPSTFKDFYSLLNVTEDGHIKSSVVDYIPQQGVGTDDWMFFSEDPLRVSYVLVPEPLTMIGLFGGASAIGAYMRKRRRA